MVTIPVPAPHGRSTDQQSGMNLLTNPPLCFRFCWGRWRMTRSYGSLSLDADPTRNKSPAMKEQWLEFINLAQQSSGLLSVSLSPALRWMSQDSPFLLLGWEREIHHPGLLGTEALPWCGIFNAKTRKSLAKQDQLAPSILLKPLCVCVVSNKGQQCGERKRRLSPCSGSNSTSRLMRTGVISGLVCVWGWNLGGKYNAPLTGTALCVLRLRVIFMFLCFSVFSKLSVITIGSMGIKTKN